MKYLIPTNTEFTIEYGDLRKQPTGIYAVKRYGSTIDFFLVYSSQRGKNNSIVWLSNDLTQTEETDKSWEGCKFAFIAKNVDDFYKLQKELNFCKQYTIIHTRPIGRTGYAPTLTRVETNNLTKMLTDVDKFIDTHYILEGHPVIEGESNPAALPFPIETYRF